MFKARKTKATENKNNHESKYKYIIDKRETASIARLTPTKLVVIMKGTEKTKAFTVCIRA
jgi:hypothetical protein